MGTENSLKFEDALKRLEEIVQSLEQGDADLDSALALFDEGRGLIKVCDEQLREAEQKLEKIGGE